MVLIMRGMNFLIEHLHRHKEGSNRKWVQPENADVCRIVCEQIFKCEVVGDWDVSTRNMKYILSNHGQINRHSGVYDIGTFL